MRRIFFVLFSLLLARSVALATDLESLGTFKISEFSLSPRLRLAEPGQGGFDLAQSWIGFEWSRDESVRGVLKLGSTDLVTPVVWNSATTEPSFGVTEAWMEGRSLYGDLRAGLLPIPTGFESMNEDWSSIFPETRARMDNWFIKRDMGLQFRWQTHFWDTSLTIHNGESSGTNSDGKYWVTAHWQYRDSDGTGVLVTSSVGQTGPESTQNSVAAMPAHNFVFDPNSEAKIRQANLSLFHAYRRNLLLLEGGSGDIIQGSDKNSFGWGHFDWMYNGGGDVSFLLRYEQDQPQMSNSDSIVRISGAGLQFSSKENLQSLTLFADHVDERPQVANDEIWLLFRIQSFFAQ